MSNFEQLLIFNALAGLGILGGWALTRLPASLGLAAVLALLPPAGIGLGIEFC